MLRLGTIVTVLLLAMPQQWAEAAEVWPSNIPVPRLSWKPCTAGPYNLTAPGAKGTLCATVAVPLNYKQPAKHSISLVVIKLPSTSKNPQGTLFMNPGGPGGAGTEDLPDWAPLFPSAVRAAFDVVSWDPRGIGLSTAVQCFDSLEKQYTFLGNRTLLGFTPKTQQEAMEWIRRMQSLAKPCRQRNGDLLDFVGTADTTRDLELLRRAFREPKLTYLGLSYGTMIGQTYAAMFPNNFRAIVIDGNLDAVEYYARSGLSQSIRVKTDLAANSVFEQFLKLCGSAPRGLCSFSAGSYQDTRNKFYKLLDRLQQGPIGIPTKANSTDGRVVTTGDLAGFISNLLIMVSDWPILDLVLTELWQNRNLPLIKPAAPVFKPGRYNGNEQGLAVQCGDNPVPVDPKYWHQTGIAETARAGIFSTYWTWQDIPCINWPGKAKNPFTGPFNINTPVPVLVLGNTFDPSTNYENSLAVATQRLPNARLLTMDGFGHTSLLNFSKCVNKWVIEYLLKGTLPPKDTVCKQDCVPFQPSFNNCTSNWRP